MELLTKLNDYWAKFSSLIASIKTGSKTYYGISIQVIVGIVATTKGLDQAELQAWFDAGLIHANNLIVLIGAITAWFRKLGKITDVK